MQILGFSAFCGCELLIELMLPVIEMSHLADLVLAAPGIKRPELYTNSSEIRQSNQKKRIARQRRITLIAFLNLDQHAKTQQCVFAQANFHQLTKQEPETPTAWAGHHT